ncbi:tail terminator [Microbacterium phage Luna18]|nr:tail terminator [Microbacterium phage Chepli]QZE10301.1 tail terminator [Microbacterium phage KatChan]URQ04864.1 tail terminator [Microbacterium phage Luna18]
MSIFTEIAELVESAPSHIGYAPTGAELPYVVSRPLLVDDLNLAVNGKTIDWDFQFSVYCCAASVEASYNLAIMVMNDLQGQRVGGTTLSTSMGYTGAQVEGHYESQVTVQLNQGGI